MPRSPMVVDPLSRRRTLRLLPGIAIAVGVAHIWLRVASPCAFAASGPEARVDLGGGVDMAFVRIEPGTFQQGSREGDPQGGKDESPRTVTLTRSFYLGKFPVTRGQFARFVSEAHYRTEAEAGPSGGFGWDGAKLIQRADFTW
jgi:sulfatase modifying factor 1